MFKSLLYIPLTILFLFIFPQAHAIELGELQVTENPDGGTPYVVRDQTQAVLVVQSTIDRDQTTEVEIAPRKKSASLSVTSYPSGAKVVFDGDEIGTTPLERNDLTPGEGMIVVSLKGYETVTRWVWLTSDVHKTENFDLIAQTRGVSITCNADGAEIILDGNLVGTYDGSPITLTKLRIGTHSLIATCDGYEVLTTTCNAEHNKVAPVSFIFTSKPGSLYVESTPTGANIVLDQIWIRKITPATIEKVSAGEHVLRLMLEDYDDVEKSILVRADKTESVAEEMRPIDKGIVDTERIPNPDTFRPFEVAPQILYGNPLPAYPTRINNTNIRGKVLVRAFVDKEGNIKDYIFDSIRPKGLGFEDEVKKVILKWRLTPAIQNHKPIGVWIKIPFIFELESIQHQVDD